MKQIAVQVRLRNNRLLQRRRELGLSIKDVCEGAGIDTTTYSRYENLNYGRSQEERGQVCRGATPRTPTGEFKPSAMKLALFFGCPPEELFPLELDRINGRAREFKADAKELRVLASQLQAAGALGGWQPPSPEDALAAKELGELLTDRQLIAVREMLTGSILADVAEELGVTRQRAQQIEAAAYAKLRRVACEVEARERALDTTESA